ncbi:MAG: hypothetical protein ACI4RP_05900 [Acutalibacteraceae bacterium]
MLEPMNALYRLSKANATSSVSYADTFPSRGRLVSIQLLQNP